MNNETINADSVVLGRFKSRVLSASTLSGDDVYNRNGNKLGSIKEIMIDIQEGSICYAVLSFGGLFSLGEKLFAIPWSAFTVDTENKRLLLDVEEEMLKKAPGFDADNWPNMADDSWRKSIHSYYTL
ncbi:PRC-barrel domain-containing protein [Iodobacter arcticus]|uniref:PRC-barrel domain-containing protein n=1 Tax=Iodobacter arcticus TaxID=590593 RepID=A0ABW2QXJ3_9NEIS